MINDGRKYSELEEWEQKIDNFDRSVRRSNKKFREHCVRINHETVKNISGDRSLPGYKILNNLSSVREDNKGEY